MGICLEVKYEIEHGLIPKSALGEIAITEVLGALETEPAESKILAYFYGTIWGSIHSSIPEF